MKKVSRVKVIAIYLKEMFKGHPFFLLTNLNDWRIEKILSVYAKRWPIETFFKDANQNLGIESCEMRRLSVIRRHWNLVFLVYNLLEFESCYRHLSKWIKSPVWQRQPDRIVVTIGCKCRMAISEIVRSFIFWTYH